MIFTYSFFLSLAVVLTVGCVAMDLHSAGQIALVWRLFPILLGGWVGAKLLFLVALALSSLPIEVDPWSGHFWWGGGAVFYGGLLGGAIGWGLSGRNFCWPLASLGLKYLLLGQAIGRLGCFVQGCCYGKAIWLHSHWVWPISLMEASWLGTLFLWGRRRERQGMSSFLWWDLSIFGQMGSRFGWEFLRGDLIRGMVGPLSLSQFLIIMCVLFYIGMRKRICSEVMANEWKNLYTQRG